MTAITSPHNPSLQEIRRLARRRERDRTRRFVAEGEDLMEAAAAAGWPALERYCAAGSGLGGREVQPQALAAVSVLGSGTRCLGVYEQRWADPPPATCVYLHGVGDPGNVGTVLRSAAAFGAASVALGPGCADPYGPKAVRASMGAVFSVALTRVGSWREVPGPRLALEPRAEGSLGDVLGALKGPVGALLVGAEREGLPACAGAEADARARIPVRGDSLNAAVATSVALYEAAKTGMLAR